jgi:hypothetical protein
VTLGCSRFGGGLLVGATPGDTGRERASEDRYDIGIRCENVRLRHAVGRVAREPMTSALGGQPNEATGKLVVLPHAPTT